MKKISLLLGIVLCSSLILSTACSRRSQAANARRAEQRDNKNNNDDSSFAAREELRETRQLAANAEVEIVNINGSIDVTTSDTDRAEIYILRLAHNKETFEKRKARILFNDNKIEIRGNDRDGKFGIWDHLMGDDEMRTRVTLKLPRKLAEIAIHGCNARVNLGEIEGRVQAHGVNGKLVIAKAVGSTEFSGINGNLDVTMAQLDKHGVSIHGVNGNIDLKFLDEVNAEVEVHGSNGRVKTDLPNVKVTEEKRGRYEATIGKGGPTIEMSGTNGNLWLGRAGVATNASKPEETSASPAAKILGKELNAR